MSKELTEQWRNGTLKFGYYYVKNRDGEVFTLGISGGFIDENLFRHIVEVLDKVPTYDQFSQLVKKVEALENAIESQADYFRQQISVLESRLKQADDALKEFCTDCLLPKCNGCDKDCAGWKAKEYLKKWGVK